MARRRRAWAGARLLGGVLILAVDGLAGGPGPLPGRDARDRRPARCSPRRRHRGADRGLLGLALAGRGPRPGRRPAAAGRRSPRTTGRSSSTARCPAAWSETSTEACGTARRRRPRAADCAPSSGSASRARWSGRRSRWPCCWPWPSPVHAAMAWFAPAVVVGGYGGWPSCCGGYLSDGPSRRARVLRAARADVRDGLLGPGGRGRWWESRSVVVAAGHGDAFLVAAWTTS